MEHRLIQGGEQWLPFARSRIKALRATGLAYASQKFEIDGCSVKVRIEPGHEYITLTGSNSVYEFFTTGELFETGGMSLGGGSADAVKGYAISVKVSAPGGVPVLVAKPTGSTKEQDSATPERWTYSEDVGAMKGFLSHKNIWQIQGSHQHVYHPECAAYPQLVSSWSSSKPAGGAGLIGFDGIDRGVYDMMYDSSPSLFAKGASSSAGGQGLAPDSDWYRRAAVRKVTHPEFGSRWFIIMSDVSGNFHAYPTGEYDNSLAGQDGYTDQWIKTNVPSRLAKSLPVPWPAWVRRPPTEAARDTCPLLSLGAKFLVEYPQYMWEFNSTATRAVAVVNQLMDPSLIYTLNPPVTGGDGYIGGTATGQTLKKPDLSAPEGVSRSIDVQQSINGLLELGLQIELTGTGSADFEFFLSVASAKEPTLTGDAYIAANYAWEVQGAAISGVSKDDLITMKMVISTGGIFDGGWLNGGFSEVVVENLATSAVLRRITTEIGLFYFPGYEVELFAPTGNVGSSAVSTILAYDLRVLAFAVQQTAIIFIQNPDAAGGHFGAWVGAAGHVKRGTRLQVIMNNVVAETVNMTDDPELLTRLDSDHSITAFGSKLPVTATAYYGGPHGRTVPGIEPLATNEFSIFPAAAYDYALAIDAAIITRSNDGFRVHPEGHWSIATSPTAYFSGVVVHDTNPFWTKDYPIDAMPEPGTVKQDFLDIVSVRYKGTEIRSSHLALFNQAYGKALTKADFFLVFEKAASVAPAGINNSFYKVYVKNKPDEASYWLYSREQRGSPVPIDGVTLTFFYRGGVTPAAFDLRNRNPTFFSGPTGSWTGVLPEAATDGEFAIHEHMPFLSGSALFSGIAAKPKMQG